LDSNLVAITEAGLQYSEEKGSWGEKKGLMPVRKKPWLGLGTFSQRGSEISRKRDAKEILTRETTDVPTYTICPDEVRSREAPVPDANVLGNGTYRGLCKIQGNSKKKKKRLSKKV